MVYLMSTTLVSEKMTPLSAGRLIALIDSCHKGLDEKEEVILILLNVSKAFDKVWHP